MPRGDERRVVSAFCDWLRSDGWKVDTEVAFIDVMAQKEGTTLIAEAKGITSSPGLDMDTAYGQLLRRMTAEPHDSQRYALVVPVETLAAALRVPHRIRALLALDVYSVGHDGAVTLHPSVLPS